MKSRFLPANARTFVALCICIGALSFLTACGSEDPEQVTDAGPDITVIDADPPGNNACGGTATLTLDGDTVEPSDSCGPCGDGTVVCDGIDDVRCVAADEANECGGCRPLHAFVGDPCGPCEDGTYECDGDGGLECVGAGEQNDCGGCTELSEEPGSSCSSGSEDGVLGCTGPDDTRCVLPGENTCGGASELSQEPGTFCGTCNQGVVACVDDDSTTCVNEDRGLNDCGGCGQLPGMVDFRCGGCDGSFICDGGNDLTCEGGNPNACGGCEALGAFPGQECDPGMVYVCDSVDSLTCPEDTTNACGGHETLNGIPLDSCGPCNDGELICATPDALTCSGASDTNPCGGCATLAGHPGTECPGGGIWECDGQDAVTCDGGAPPANACGGTETLDGQPGAHCSDGDRDGVWQCDGSDAVTCHLDDAPVDECLDSSDCSGSEICHDGQCKESSGTCQSNTDCDVGEICEAGNCISGECTPTTTCASEGALCGEIVDDCGDTHNCGGCGDGESCVEGDCVPSGECEPNETQCSGECADIESDPDHCGGCGSSCEDGEICEGGECSMAFSSPPPSCMDTSPPARCSEPSEEFDWEPASNFTSLAVTQDCCADLTGDGEPDNAWATMQDLDEPDLQSTNDTRATRIDDGELVYLLEHDGITDLEDSADYILNFFHGHHLNGDTFIDPASIEQGTYPFNLFADTTLANGSISAAQGVVSFEFFMNPLWLTLPVRHAQLSGDVVAQDSDLDDGIAIEGGEIAGAIMVIDILEPLNNYAADCDCLSNPDSLLNYDQSNPTSVTCDEASDEYEACYDLGDETCGEVAQACPFYGTSMGMFADLDISGDGNHDAFSVGLTFEADGVQIEGVNE